MFSKNIIFMLLEVLWFRNLFLKDIIHLWMNIGKQLWTLKIFVISAREIRLLDNSEITRKLFPTINCEVLIS